MPAAKQRELLRPGTFTGKKQQTEEKPAPHRDGGVLGLDRGDVCKSGHRLRAASAAATQFTDPLMMLPRMIYQAVGREDQRAHITLVSAGPTEPLRRAVSVILLQGTEGCIQRSW